MSNPSFNTNTLLQTAALWEVIGISNSGTLKYNPNPITLPCRWEDRTEQFFDPDGELSTSKSIIFLDRRIQRGDRIARIDCDGVCPPFHKSFVVRAFLETPDLRNMTSEYKAVL